MDTTSAAGEDAENRELLTAAVGDRCTSCQAQLASDQRYCVNCGARRGKAQVSFAALAGQSASPPAPAAPPRRRPRGSAGATFVAGVGTLLLAMGVGVLIGHNGNTSPQRASAPGVQVVTVAGGGGSGSGTGSARKDGGRSSHKAAKHLKAKAVKAKLSKKVVHAATAAASKVLGGNAPKNPTVTVGQKGSGAGYQGGKFTGGFFGP